MNHLHAVQLRLQNMIHRNRIPHALAFSSPASEDKKALAELFLFDLFCAGEERMDLIQKKLLERNHPDVLWVEPEKKELKIEQIRSLIRWLQIAPNQSKRKVAVVVDAHLMNRSASNSFLKTLEEPPPHALILLLITRVHHLLPTIRSRVQSIRIPDEGIREDRTFTEKPWYAAFTEILKSPNQATADQIFEVSALVDKDPEEIRSLLYYFQRSLKERVLRLQETDPNHPSLLRADALFSFLQRLELELIAKYGNTSLSLERALLEWRRIGQ